MKKGIVSVAIMLIIMALLITTANAAFTASISMKSDSSTIKVGDTVTLTINVNEKVVASNFDINYDSTILKLEGSGTSNLSVAEKDGKIACIYADMSGTGTNEFKVKFKALKETTGTNLKIENAKFRADGKDESYTGEQISGINNTITVKVGNTQSTEEKTPSTGNQVAGKDKTTSKTSNLPKTGKETGFVIAGIALLVVAAIVFGKKSKELSKIFSSLSVFVVALVMLTSLNKNVYAAITDKTNAVAEAEAPIITNTEEPKQFGSGLLSNGEKYMGILANKSDSDRKIKTADLTETGKGITQVYNDKKEPTSNDGQDIVKTGYYLTKAEGEYKIVLYGDANGDGIICDTDDVMVIIEDYLGKKTAGELNKLAANLDARDDVLDADDLIQMINMYLGKLDKDLVIEGIDIIGQWEYSSAIKNGQEVSFNEVFGSSAIGSTGYLTFKEDGTFVNNYPGATSIELENEGKYSINGNNIKIQFSNKSDNLTYNSKDNTISYPYGEYTLILKKYSEDKEYLNTNWEYSIEGYDYVVLKKYIGSDVDVTIKEYYNMDGIQYKTRMGKTTTYNPVYGTEAYGPFVDNKSINTITFESTNILEGDISCLFYQCTNLKRVIGFGGNITKMDNAFTRCTSLLNEQKKDSTNYVEGAEINIPDSVENLDYAFMECSSMTYLPGINRGSKLTTAKSAFYQCTGATSGTIYLTETVTNISEMFSNCRMLGNYTGTGFVVYSYLNTDLITFYNTFNYCGVEPYGGSAYGTKEYEIIVKNDDLDQKNKALEFFKQKISESTQCYLTVRAE